MNATLHSAIDKQWAEFERWAELGEALAALVCLGEIHQAAIARAIDDESSRIWLDRLRRTPLEEELIRSARRQAGADLQQLRQILSHGDEFLYEELVLEVAHSRQNMAEFRSAQAAVRANWGTPIRSRWLEVLH